LNLPRFSSLKQAYHLFKNKKEVFRQIAGVYGVPPNFHPYKKMREKGVSHEDAILGINDPRYALKKWQTTLKNQKGSS
tara:strand:- start:933 stop:1166 length:234 start_codon:yes stop_codon:yes gene_type:complete